MGLLMQGEWIDEAANNGIYRCRFATSEAAYEGAVHLHFDTVYVGHFK